MEARYMTDLEWRICHAVNIYVFKNGNDMQTPILVHIPPSRKKNMQSVMDTVQERVTYPVGYAKTLFKMDGTRIRHPCELEMYNNYVVASNFEKAFKCVEYGRKRSPLLVLNRYSKHIRVLRLHNENYDQWLQKKREMGSERPQYVYPERYIHEGILPQDLPVDRMGNTYVPNCNVDPKDPNYAVNHGMRKMQLRSNQQNNYTVNAFTIEQDPIEEYLQHAESNEVEEHNERQFKVLGQDQVFYQPQTKWRTKGVLDKNKDEHPPLFPTASDTLNANFPTENEEEIEDIAELEDDNFNDAVEVLDTAEEYDSNPAVIFNQERRNTPNNTPNTNKSEKRLPFARKAVPSTLKTIPSSQKIAVSALKTVSSVQRMPNSTQKKVPSAQKKSVTLDQKKIIHASQKAGSTPQKKLVRKSENSSKVNLTQEAKELDFQSIKQNKNGQRTNKDEHNIIICRYPNEMEEVNSYLPNENLEYTEVTEDQNEMAEQSAKQYQRSLQGQELTTEQTDEVLVKNSEQFSPFRTASDILRTVRELEGTCKTNHSADSYEMQEKCAFKKMNNTQKKRVIYLPQKERVTENQTSGALVRRKDDRSSRYPASLIVNASSCDEEYVEGVASLEEDDNLEEDYDSNPVTVTVSMNAKKNTPNKNERTVSFAQRKSVRKITPSYKIIHSSKSNEKQYQSMSKRSKNLRPDRGGYQQQKKWANQKRTNGVVIRNKDSHILNATTDEDSEGIAKFQNENCTDVEDDLDEDYDSNPVTVTVRMNPKKNPANKMEKKPPISQKTVPVLQKKIVRKNENPKINRLPVAKEMQGHCIRKKNSRQDLVLYLPKKKKRTNGVAVKYKDENTPRYPIASQNVNESYTTEDEEDGHDENGNDVEVSNGLDGDYDGSTVTVTVSMHEKKDAPNKKERPISFAQRAAKQIEESYNIIRSARRYSMREKYTQTESD